MWEYPWDGNSTWQTKKRENEAGPSKKAKTLQEGKGSKNWIFVVGNFGRILGPADRIDEGTWGGKRCRGKEKKRRVENNWTLPEV